ncbi:AtpZ/AtpI family protein [Pseudonocardia xishanensis]|uniref:F0F1-ATPase subunit (Ca2+/Mg2+ transporter) n=1 Tax=Pseudonocardia xishanensis TaxID=630995 RepID=A0ABP8RIP3_9PSEU
MEQEQPREVGSGAPGEQKPDRTPPPAEAWTALSHLLTGILLFGAIGWGVDQLFDLRGFTVAGLLAGAAASMYLIYVRYVKS